MVTEPELFATGAAVALTPPTLANVWDGNAKLSPIARRYL